LEEEREGGGVSVRGGGGAGGGGEWRKDLERKRWRKGVAIHWGTEGGKREGGWEMEEGEGGGMCQWMVVDRGEGHTKCQ